MFIGILEYEFLPQPELSFVGRPLYVVTAPFGYLNDRVKKNYTVWVEDGFITDFASIPNWLFFLNPKDHDWRNASVIHDKACDLARCNEITMKQADDYLYYAMRENGSTVITSFAFWLCARAYHALVVQR